MTDLKYVPVLRHRQEERAALSGVRLSAKVLPLIEIVKDLPRSNSRGTFSTVYTGDLTALNRPLMVDFPTYLPLAQSTNTDVLAFLRPVQVNPQRRIDLFRQLQAVPDLIPVVTYNPQIQFAPGVITNTAQALRPTFPRLAFRLFYNGLTLALQEVRQAAQHGDVIVLDVDDAPHVSPALTRLYPSIVAMKASHGCSTVLVRSAMSDGLTNTSFNDDQPVPSIDNSLLTAYQGYGFDAFGDYAGIKKDLLRTGGTISPGFVFYSYQTNLSIGYRGRTRRLQEFKQHIAPTVVGSQYYQQYGAAHQGSCPGCRMIDAIANGPDSGASQGLWKRIAVMHYLHTMEENL